jgi:hypothetical protein
MCFPRLDSPSGPRPPHHWASSITLRHITLGRTPLDEGSDCWRDLYMATNNAHKRQPFMPPGRIRTRNPSMRATADPRLRPRGHWNQHPRYLAWNNTVTDYFIFKVFYDNAVSFEAYIPLAIAEWVRIIGRVILKGKNLSQCCFVPHKPHMDWPSIEPGSLKPPTNHLRHAWPD